MQANASNYFLDIPILGPWLEKAAHWLIPTEEKQPLLCPEVATADCGFLVTSLVVLPNGDYQICVQANNTNNPFLPHNWQVVNWGLPPQPTVATGTGAVNCWTIPGSFGPGFNIFHTVTDDSGPNTCSTFVYLLPSEKFCEENTVSAVVNNCFLETTISIDVNHIGTPYVLTFGDGSPAVQSSSSSLTHTYAQVGTYDVCITYAVPGYEVGSVTCCYPISVGLPAHCVCPENVISVQSIEPCTWTAFMNFDLVPGIFPINVDFGDGSNVEVFYGPAILHQFPGPGSYHVCYGYEAEPGFALECCEQVNIPGCCLDPTFELDQLIESPSCLNPLYGISHVACQGGIVAATHIWQFSDGTVYVGPYPPDHLFTNFLDADGEVCVTHTVVCCDESASATVCANHPAGAYIGYPQGEAFFSDHILTTGQEVWEFIQMHANDPSLPLTIDGTLIADKNVSTFNHGVWNMGRNAEIIVRAKYNPLGLSPVRTFSLDGTIIQSAVRLGPARGACCRWIGIRSEGRTSISLGDAYLMDAKYAIRYPAPAIPSAGNIASTIVSTGSHFLNNWIGIKSDRQLVSFPNFSDNEMDGAPHEQVCGCDAINAFDFNGVNSTLTTVIPLHPFQVNTIRNYEKAFRVRNSNINVRRFDIEALQNYNFIGDLLSPLADNNSDNNDSAIGIDFSWAHNGSPSSLTLDEISFTDFIMSGPTTGVAVRDRIFSGTHTLTAVASDPLSSITTAEVAGGYELLSLGTINGTISGNSISTNGDKYGFGVNGNFFTAGNTLEINGNTMEIGSNTSSTLNGGVVLSSAVNSLGQQFKVLGNTINLYLAQGPGIGITNTLGYIVRRNKLKNGSSATGIQLLNGGSALVDCNDVRSKPLGLDVTLSSSVRYEANFFKSNTNDVKFTGNVLGSSAFPTRIQKNIFRGFGSSSMVYTPNAVTGNQFHNQYNRWEFPGSTAPTILLSNGSNNQYWRPSGATQPSPMFPSTSLGSSLFVLAGTSGVDTITTDAFCTSAHDDFEEFAPGPDPKDDWAAIVTDGSYWSGLTAAEKNYMRQEIYGLLLDNPSWTGTSSTLAGFKTSEDASFVGQSESLRQDWQQLMGDITAYQTSLAPTNAVLESLAAQVQVWLGTIQVDTTLQDSLELLIAASLAEADSLQDILQLADSLFYQSVEDSLGLLLTANTLLDEDSLYAWYEKRYNEIVLNWLAGTEPDSTATADLRTIAQTCLRYGGRAVLGARGLCEVWLNEYYDENNCNPSLQSRSNEGPASAKLAANPSLRIMPNPAHDQVRVSLQNSVLDDQKLQIFAADGRKVYEGKLQSNGELEIPVSGWQNGLYMAKVSNGNKVQTCNFVVQHP